MDPGLLPVLLFCPWCLGPEEFHNDPTAVSAVTLTLSSSSTLSSTDIGSDGKAEKSFYIVASNSNRVLFLLKGNLSESCKTDHCIPFFHSTVFFTCPCTDSVMSQSSLTELWPPHRVGPPGEPHSSQHLLRTYKAN